LELIWGLLAGDGVFVAKHLWRGSEGKLMSKGVMEENHVGIENVFVSVHKECVAGRDLWSRGWTTAASSDWGSFISHVRCDRDFVKECAISSLGSRDKPLRVAAHI
jgi:hypothetical protein